MGSKNNSSDSFKKNENDTPCQANISKIEKKLKSNHDVYKEGMHKVTKYSNEEKGHNNKRAFTF